MNSSMDEISVIYIYSLLSIDIVFVRLGQFNIKVWWACMSGSVNELSVIYIQSGGHQSCTC